MKHRKVLLILSLAAALGSCATASRAPYAVVIRDLELAPGQIQAAPQAVGGDPFTLRGLRDEYQEGGELNVLLVHGIMTTTPDYGEELMADVVLQLTGHRYPTVLDSVPGVDGDPVLVRRFDRKNLAASGLSITAKAGPQGDASGSIQVYRFAAEGIRFVSVFWKPLAVGPEHAIAYNPLREVDSRTIRRAEQRQVNTEVKASFLYSGFADALVSTNPQAQARLRALMDLGIAEFSSEGKPGRIQVITHSAGSLVFDQYLRQSLEGPDPGTQVSVLRSLGGIRQVYYLSNQISLLDLTRRSDLYPTQGEVLGTTVRGAADLGRLVTRGIDALQSYVTSRPEGTEPGAAVCQVVAFTDPSDLLSMPVVNLPTQDLKAVNVFLPMTRGYLKYAPFLGLEVFGEPFYLVNPLDAHTNFLRKPEGSADAQNPALRFLLREGKIRRNPAALTLMVEGWKADKPWTQGPILVR